MSARILVVDDDACIRDLLKLHLSAAGHQVRVAEDALVAGRMLLSSAPDLMIVDVEMPYMSGIEFVATILADQTLPNIPVLFLTSRDDLADRASALGASYLTKPCRKDVLLNAVQGCLLAVAEASARLGPRASVRAA
jgi:DNA-binding response OmpR family regulator